MSNAIRERKRELLTRDIATAKAELEKTIKEGSGWLADIVSDTKRALEELAATEGADELKEYVRTRLRSHYLGMTDIEQPLSIILVGPSGVGKTFWAEKYMAVMAACKIVWFPFKTRQKKGGGDFIASYLGQTIPKVRGMIASAFEQCVMIDEMYLMGTESTAEAVGLFTADLDAYKASNLSSWHKLRRSTSSRRSTRASAVALTVCSNSTRTARTSCIRSSCTNSKPNAETAAQGPCASTRTSSTTNLKGTT